MSLWGLALFAAGGVAGVAAMKLGAVLAALVAGWFGRRPGTVTGRRSR